jgi:hypothetical protein
MKLMTECGETEESIWVKSGALFSCCIFDSMTYSRDFQAQTSSVDAFDYKVSRPHHILIIFDAIIGGIMFTLSRTVRASVVCGYICPLGHFSFHTPASPVP